jgi:hypothetical protein
VRDLAKQIVIEAATAAGLGADLVQDESPRDNVILPRPRLEVAVQDEAIKRSGRWFARLPGAGAGTVIFRRRTHIRTLFLRCVYKAEAESAVEAFVTGFITSLPKVAADDGDNAVYVKPERVMRGGYQDKLVEAIVRREAVILIGFTGGIYFDEVRPLIPDIRLTTDRDGEELITFTVKE